MFHKKELISVSTLKDYSKVKEKLSQNNIRFWVKTKDNFGGGIFEQRRSSGTFGLNMEYSTIYRIFVRKEDYERAKEFI